MNLVSTEEGVWKEIVRVQLTEEERSLITNRSEEVRESRNTLLARIRSESEKSVSKKLSAELTELYNSHKPELKENDIYQLISADLSGEGNHYNGIINCRVNGEHKQIRF